jgi:hypothetical protein
MKCLFISYAIIQLLFSASQSIECPDNYYGVEEGITLNECRDMGNGDYEKYWCQNENTVLVGFYKDAECSSGTEWWTAPYQCTLEGGVNGVAGVAGVNGLNAYPCKCDFSCKATPFPTVKPTYSPVVFVTAAPTTASTSKSVDRITSDCAGNEIERQTVTIDECQLEPFPNAPSQPFKYFCDDNNQLGLKYYGAGVDNCDGVVQVEYILDSAGQCSDGLIFSSTCGESIPICPKGTTQIGVLNADIGGCGLQSCDERYQDNYQNIQDCADACANREDCLSFTWAPMDGDKNHPGKTVCTLYNSDISNQEWGPAQIMCKPNPPKPDGLCCECTAPTTTPGCSVDLTCQQIICGADPFCCDHSWDQLCSNAAGAECGGN